MQYSLASHFCHSDIANSNTTGYGANRGRREGLGTIGRKYAKEVQPPRLHLFTARNWLVLSLNHFFLASSHLDLAGPVPNVTSHAFRRLRVLVRAEPAKARYRLLATGVLPENGHTRTQITRNRSSPARHDMPTDVVNGVPRYCGVQ